MQKTAKNRKAAFKRDFPTKFNLAGGDPPRTRFTAGSTEHEKWSPQIRGQFSYRVSFQITYKLMMLKFKYCLFSMPASGHPDPQID